MTLLGAVDHPQLRRSQPQAWLCNALSPGRCLVQVNDLLYYADDDHLSMLGARLVIDDMLTRARAMR